MFGRAIRSPLYKQLYQGIEDSRIEISADRILKRGEESILRQRNVTGGVRSGGTNRDLFEFGADLDERLQIHTQTEDQRITQEQNALLESAYNQQLAGASALAGLPMNTSQIAQTTANIGNTASQAAIAQGQIKQQTAQNIGGAITGGAGNLLTAYSEGLI